jgi:hypothetical protein
MVEVLLLLLAYALALDCLLRQSDVGALPSVVRRRALGGLVRRRAGAVVVVRASAEASGQAARAARGVPGGRL